MVSPIRAGDLNRLIWIDRPEAASVDGFGQEVLEWALLRTAWASYKPIKDSERFANGEVTATITCRFLVRYSPELAEVDERHRVRFDGRVFDVIAVKEVGYREALEISAAARSERG